MNVVEQDPHPHAALGRRDDARQQQLGREVVSHAVVLEVERSLGGDGQRGAGYEGLPPGRDDPETGQARML